MRVLALFFACYFTVLGCLPCADAEPCATTTQGTVLTATHPGCGTSPDCADWCSPFCQCHCCAGFSLPKAAVVVLLAGPLVVRYAPLPFAVRPADTLLTRAPATPWQPPQGA